MKVRLPLMIQDAEVADSKDMPDLVERYEFTEEKFFLDGPVTERIAVLDFDPDTGELLPGAKFLPPRGNRKIGRYDVQEPGPGSPITREFIQVSVLATILKTMSIAEDKRILGRKLFWAFDAPQLLVIPQAGEWANAFYERDSHSLQFFYFGLEGADRVYTSLSRDIVAHETAHAILDGIVPDLYDALTPQSLALHEAFADLTAVIMAMHSSTLTKTVLQQTRGELGLYTTAFNRIAEQFGLERYGRHSLRDLSQRVTMEEVDSVEPHALSTVLSGALYELLIKIYEWRQERLATAEAERFDDPFFSLSGKALFLAVQQFSRMLFRALDYLPPGEISFADFGRAILAADKVAFPVDDSRIFRDILREAFLSRKIITTADDLEVEVDFPFELKRPVNLDDLVESDWVAYEFANRPDVRKLLGIPDEIQAFRVHRRLKTVKEYTAAKRPLHDIVFKVSWEHIEDNDVGHGLPTRRRITAGSTLVINAEASQDAPMDPEDAVVEVAQDGLAKMPIFTLGDLSLRYSQSGKNVLHVRACLKSDLEQQSQRDEMLRHLLEEGIVELAAEDMEETGQRGQSTIVAHLRNNVVNIAGTGRMLHITTR